MTLTLRQPIYLILQVRRFLTMSYSINELAKLAGISTRTLRYYDKQGLLKARRDPVNNYRYYEETEVDQLQKILFLKLFDLPLEQIKKVMQTSSETQYQVLRSQRSKLVAEQQYLDDLIKNLDKTLATMKEIGRASCRERV